MELTGIEIEHLVREMRRLEDGKIQKVYQTEDYPLILDLYAREFPYRYLLVSLPGLVFFAKEKPKMPSKPLGLAQRTRAQLSNARIRSVRQHAQDRIIIIEAEHKQRYELIIELFAKGNIILVREDTTIANILRSETYATRDLRPGKHYALPPPTPQIPLDTPEAFAQALRKSQGKHLVAIIASAGYGGKYAQHALTEAVPADRIGNITVDDLDALALEKIRSSLKELHETRSYAKPPLLLLGNDHASIIDALAGIEPIQAKEVPKQPQSKQERIVSMQTKRASELEAQAERETKLGEAIFEHYALLRDVLEYATAYRTRTGSLNGLENEWPEHFPKLIGTKGKDITIDMEKVGQRS